MQVLALPLAIFKIWMLVDAIQRFGGSCRSSYWFYICWVPFGDWAYFFAIKIHDPEFSRLTRKLFYRPASLDKVRATAELFPSHENRLKLAKALFDNEQFSDARTICTELASRGSDKEIEYLEALCDSRLKQYEAAQSKLEALTAKDLSFKDYDAALELAGVLADTGAVPASLECLKRIYNSSCRMSHAVYLAQQLIRSEQKDEARKVLEGALKQQALAPKCFQKADRKAISTAKNLLKRYC